MAVDDNQNAPISSEESKKNRDIIALARKRFQIAREADDHNREQAMEDVKFVNIPGEQWESSMKKERGKRPCWEFNKIRISNKRVINNMRANRPSAKVRGVERTDKSQAEIRTGLVRNIFNMSDFDTIVDYAAKYQVDGGMGAWRVLHDYFDDESFEQDIFIEAIPNPFTLFWAPHAVKPLKEDSDWWILTEKLPQEEYEYEYAGKEVINWPSHEFDDDEEWDHGETVRVAEYWWREPTTFTLLRLDDGKIVRSDREDGKLILEKEPARVVAQREVNAKKIMYCKMSGAAMLEAPKEWPGKYFPFVVITGDYIVIDGKPYWNGNTRFAKDAQRSYNVSRTAVAETIAQAPKSYHWATTEQAKGNLNQWKDAHQKNYPVLLYNHDPQEPGPPKRTGGADIPVALIQETQMAAEEINMVTGIYQSDIGAPSGSTSGRHEIAKQNAGHLATFDFEDNAAKGIRHTAVICIDLIPRVYDSERTIRILGPDDSEEFVDINTFVPGEDGKPVKINDLAEGKFDVTVRIGPNFTTKRQEASETYQALLQGAPQLFGIIGDLIFKTMDLPYADEIAERIQVTLPPEIQKQIGKDKNIEVPPEIEMMMQEVEQAMQLVEAGIQEVNAQAAELETDKAEVEKLKAELDADVAEFKGEIALQVAKLVERQAKLVIDKAQLDARDAVDEARDQVAAEADAIAEEFMQETAAGMEAFKQVAEAFQGRVSEALDEIKQVAEQRPQIAKIRQEFDEDGRMVVVPEYAGADDGEENEE